MRHQAIALSVVLLSGCQTFSETPQRVLSFAGDYAAIADCSYLKIEAYEGFWRKEDLPSIKTARLIKGEGSTQIGRIDFVGTPDGKTRVDMRFQMPIQGSDHFPNVYQPMIDACAAAAPATTAPAAPEPIQ